LPTFITHSVIGVTAAYSFRSGKESLKFFFLSILCSNLPDGDVIGYHWLYVPSHYFFGHRGFFHSPFFAALLSIFIVSVFYGKEVAFSKQWWKYFFYFFILTASHGLLDALTNGGHGIAFLSPLNNERYFFPWTPLDVSPLDINSFLSHRGLKVLAIEVLWIWVPCFIIAVVFKKNRKLKKEKN
jgi:inner membrane protein